MNVSLKPELQQFVEEQVKAGLAQLMLQMDDDEIDDETMAKIEEAEAQFERGEGMSIDEVISKLRQKHPGI